MNRFKSLLIGLALLLGLPAFGQTILVNTTLSGAVSTASTTKIVVASATGINAPSLPSAGSGFAQRTATVLYIDREAMDVTGVSGTTITVTRGTQSTAASPHASAAVVFVLPRNLLIAIGGGMVDSAPSYPAGSCTRTNEIVLPRIQLTTGLISDCLGGQWVNGDATQTTRPTYANFQAPPTGGTIYTSLGGTGTTLSATLMYCSEIDLPFSKLITGLGVLNGTTATTDNHLVALYDATGNLIANSATAGVLAATASEYQNISFTAKYYVPGPTQLFGCLQTNGTTATVRMLATQVTDTYLTKSITDVFGTIPATITVPTTFTTAVGPYFTVF